MFSLHGDAARNPKAEWWHLPGRSSVNLGSGYAIAWTEWKIRIRVSALTTGQGGMPTGNRSIKRSHGFPLSASALTLARIHPWRTRN
mmetsp:Transcript_15527/g.31419  ORF Transcript_15527/g.31419 Transcript_15527/m.31419 type:complete len:87 (+) Transcript_15527:858-1118(+)